MDKFPSSSDIYTQTIKAEKTIKMNSVENVFNQLLSSIQDKSKREDG